MNYEIIICTRNGDKVKFIVNDYEFAEDDPSTMILTDDTRNREIVVNTNNLNYYIVRDISDLNVDEFKETVMGDEK